MEQEDINRLRELHEAATPGPWKNEWRSGSLSEGNITAGVADIAIVMGANYGQWRDSKDDGEAEFKANGDLIAESRDALPTLIAQAERVKVLEEALECVRPEVFEVLRRHDVSEQCFAEVAMVTHEINRTALEQTGASSNG